MSPGPPFEGQDEQYASSDDPDFAPDTAPDPASDESDSEDAKADGPSKRKHTTTSTPDDKDEDDGYNNSGDEAIIAKGHRKRRNRAQEDGRPLDNGEGGEGGLVKTRAQRAAEKEKRGYAVNNAPVTIDVDAVWAQMISSEPFKTNRDSTKTKTETNEDTSTTKSQPDPSATNKLPPETQSDTIRIKRTYNFAGRVHTEEKVVARDSAEAILYLASQAGKEAGVAADTSSPTKRATRKAFRSAFEPTLDSGPGRRDLNLGLAARIQAGKEAQARKLNTVEKSRMDWAGYVDKEGIKDELALAGKSKDSFAARQDFLARSEAIREDDARRARISART